MFSNYELKKYDEANKYMHKYFNEIDKDSVKYSEYDHYYAALIHEALGNKDNAKDSYHKALELVDEKSIIKRWDILKTLSTSHKKDGDLENAIKYYNEFLSCKPEVKVDDYETLADIREKELADPAMYISLPRLDPMDWTAFSINNDIYFLSNRYGYSELGKIYNNIPRMVAADSAVFHQSEPSIFLQAALMNQGQLSSEIKIRRARLEWYEANHQEPDSSVDDYQELWDARLSALTSPYLHARYQATLEELLAEQAGRYDLPEGEATDIFRKLVEPFRGKWVYIDFWATSCVPCRSGIESSADVRKKLAGRDDIELVFITGDRSSPQEAYREYVDKNLEGEVSYLLPETQYILLSGLFNFTGIPHNELVDPDGRIVCGKDIPRLGPGFIEQIESLISE